MRSCEDFESLLPAYVAGIADPADVQEIGEHIGECAPCMNDFQSIVHDLGTLKAWKDPSPPEGLASRVLERIVELSEAPRQAPAAAASVSSDPITHWLSLSALTVMLLVIVAAIITARHQGVRMDRQRACANNLRLIGEAAGAGRKAPLQQAVRRTPGKYDEQIFVCPIAGAPEPPNVSSYLDLPGPVYLVGDLQRNHKYKDANILLADGSVIIVTPAQKRLWDMLAPGGGGKQP